MKDLKHIEVLDLDLQEAVCLCHAALAQDSPELPEFYINSIMNLLYGYLSGPMRAKVEEYLAEKKYLPPVDIQIVK